MSIYVGNKKIYPNGYGNTVQGSSEFFAIPSTSTLTSGVLYFSLLFFGKYDSIVKVAISIENSSTFYPDFVECDRTSGSESGWGDYVLRSAYTSNYRVMITYTRDNVEYTWKSPYVFKANADTGIHNMPSSAYGPGAGD